MFKFGNHPAAIGISDGIGDAFSYLQTSWRRWLPVVGAIAACTFVMYELAGPVNVGSLYYIDPDTGRLVIRQDATDRLVGLFVIGAVTGVMTSIGSWFFYATAVAGLRNRPLTFSGVIVRGLVTVASGLVVLAGFAVAIVGVVLVTVIVPPIGILLILAAIPASIYVAIRLAFLAMAIFDGFGPIAALRESWRLSERSVLRLLGWGLMAFLISMGVGIIANILVAPANDLGPQPLAQAFSEAITTTGSCLTVFIMAVLYESQRARLDPTLYPYTPGPAYPYPFPVGPYPTGPYPPGSYPYAPANPNAGRYPYQGAAPGYPGSSTAIPGWVNPNSPPAWPVYPYVPPAQWPSPAAGQAEVSNEPPEKQPTETNPTDPPVSS